MPQRARFATQAPSSIRCIEQRQEGNGTKKIGKHSGRRPHGGGRGSETVESLTGGQKRDRATPRLL